MFLGHYAAGLAAKKVAPGVSLGTLFLAGQFLDLLWPTFLLLGWERAEIEPGITVMTPLNFTHYPISHSLLTAIGWGLLFGLLYLLIRKDRRGAFVLGLLVVSHWILDWFLHRPDLPLYPGSAVNAGLGGWNSPLVTFLAEGLLFAGGIWLYLRATQARDRVGSYAFWALIVFMAGIFLANSFGPPPPDMTAVAWAGQLQWIFVLWGYWIDRHRSPPRP